MLTTALLLVTAAASLVAADCNPLQTATCPPIPGLATSTYSVDFTKETALPDGWILADASNVTFTPEGAKFWFNHRGSAPYIWTNWYMAYGQVDVEMQIAQGTGIITSAVLFSDDADEIDWEFSGSNFGTGCAPNFNGKAFTNYFGKGITGVYDRATLQDCWQPQYQFHTYSWNWSPDSLTWFIDGQSRHTQANTYATSGDYQYPQTPARLHIGCWDAGDPNTLAGTVNWAGGYTDYNQVPYYAILKRVNIVTTNPCALWQYPPNFSGQWKDVQCLSSTLSSSSVSSTSTTSTVSTSSTTSTTITSSSSSSTYTTITASSVSSPSSTTTTSSSSVPSSTGITSSPSVTSSVTTTSSASYCAGTIYTVVAGDYAYKIASMFGVSMQALQNVNPSQDMNNVWAEQRMTIPCGGTIPSTMFNVMVSQTNGHWSTYTPGNTGSMTSTGATSTSTNSSPSPSPSPNSTPTSTSTSNSASSSTSTTTRSLRTLYRATPLSLLTTTNTTTTTSTSSSSSSPSSSSTTTTTLSRRPLIVATPLAGRGYNMDDDNDDMVETWRTKLGKRSGMQYNGNVAEEYDEDESVYGSREDNDIRYHKNRRGYLRNLW